MPTRQTQEQLAQLASLLGLQPYSLNQFGVPGTGVGEPLPYYPAPAGFVSNPPPDLSGIAVRQPTASSSGKFGTFYGQQSLDPPPAPLSERRVLLESAAMDAQEKRARRATNYLERDIDYPREARLPGQIEGATVDAWSRSPKGSTTIEYEGKWYLVPGTTPDGTPLSPDDVRAQFQHTGEHFGVFRTSHAADAAAIAISRLVEGD